MAVCGSAALPKTIRREWLQENFQEFQWISMDFIFI